MKRIKYLYFLFLLYLVAGFFRELPFISKKIYEILYNYMGLMLIPTTIFFTLYGFIFIIEDKKRKLFWELRLYYVYMLSFLITYIFILSKLDINFRTAPTFKVNADFIRNLINKCLFEYEIGYLPTYLLYEFINLPLRFNQFPFYYFYYALYGLGFFLFLLIILIPFIKSIIKTREKRKKERKKARIEAELMEQIQIKEQLEKGEKVNLHRSKKHTTLVQKNRKKEQAETEVKVVEKLAKSGIVLKKTVTIKDE